MSDQLELYKRWAPDTAMWTQWAKPVVFMSINFNLSYRAVDYSRPIKWTDYQEDRLLIVDLPGVGSLSESISLARLGYRPVPLFNGVQGSPNAVVPIKPIIDGLRTGGEQLANLTLSSTANPVFLLDSNRLEGAKKVPGTFDNRWCVVAQDLPSASYLMKHGIKEIMVRTDELLADLQHLLYGYQRQGIKVQVCNNQGRILLGEISKPKRGGLFYRFLMLLGLSRNATGGFGMSIVEASSGGGGYRAG